MRVVEAAHEQEVVICSITSIGLAMPPAQNAFQTLSILERSSPVSMPNLDRDVLSAAIANVSRKAKYSGCLGGGCGRLAGSYFKD
jgi:hypothetical protein